MTDGGSTHSAPSFIDALHLNSRLRRLGQGASHFLSFQVGNLIFSTNLQEVKPIFWAHPDTCWGQPAEQ